MKLTTSEAFAVEGPDGTRHEPFFAVVALTAQTGSIGSTALATSPAAGLYRANIYVSVTTAGSAGALDLTLSWTDGAGAQSVAVVATLDLSGANSASASQLIEVASGNINYSTTLVGGAGSPQYSVKIRLERIQ